MQSITRAGATTRSFTYTPNGNIATDTRSGTAYAYAYNNANRLASVTVGGQVKGTYLYNGLEQLAARTLANMTPAGAIHSVYDIAGHLIAETDGFARTVREYVWLGDMPLAAVANVNTTPVIYWVHSDHLDRPIKMTNAAKASVWDALWLPFGAVQQITGTASLDARFPGQWFQLESGLAYNWNRHYDPTLGRYTQADPLGFVDGPAIYAYAGNSPLMWTDPDGLCLQSRMHSAQSEPMTSETHTLSVAPMMDWSEILSFPEAFRRSCALSAHAAPFFLFLT